MSNKSYLGILLSIFMYTYSFAQVEVSGACFGGSTISLASSGTQNGREIFMGMGTVSGNPNITITVYWEPAAPGWVLAFSGQPFYLDSNDTPQPNSTTAGNWSVLGSPPCPVTDVTITGGSTLPVELTFFKGELRNDMSHLSWQTASETDNLGFGILRSADGASWEDLGFVEGADNSTETLDYRFVDTHPLEGVNYYRLRQVDIDGTFEYSDVIQINNKKEKDETITIFPNPVKEKLNIIGVDFTNAQISIYDRLGRLVKATTNQTALAEIDVDELPKSTYIIQVRRGSQVFVEKFVKI